MVFAPRHAEGVRMAAFMQERALLCELAYKACCFQRAAVALLIAVVVTCLWVTPVYADDADKAVPDSEKAQAVDQLDEDDALSVEALEPLPLDNRPLHHSCPHVPLDSDGDWETDNVSDEFPSTDDLQPESSMASQIFAELRSSNELHFSTAVIEDIVSAIPLFAADYSFALSGDGVAPVAPDAADLSGANAAVARYSVGAGDYNEESRPPWYDDRDVIRSVTFDEGVRPQSMSYWFDGLASLEQVDFDGLDTSLVSSMRRLFGGCSALASVDVSSFDTSNVADMAQMFDGCSSLTKLDLSSFDTSNLQTAEGMFAGCSSLAVLDVSTFSSQLLASASLPILNFNAGRGVNPEAPNHANGSSEQASASELSGRPVNAAGSSVATVGLPNSPESEALAMFVASDLPATVDTSAIADASTSPAVPETREALPVADQAQAPLLDPGAVASATTSVLNTLGLTSAVDKAFGMAVAATGMIVAAGLLLVLCLKIR